MPIDEQVDGKTLLKRNRFVELSGGIPRRRRTGGSGAGPGRTPSPHHPSGRAAAYVSLDDPYAVASLLESLREAGAQEQAAVLADRAAAHASLHSPGAVARLLDSLRRAGAEQEAAVLAERAAAQVSLSDPRAVGWLLDSLWAAGAREQAACLADRLPGAGLFELFRKQEGRQDRFRFGREADGTPARPWGWEYLD